MVLIQAVGFIGLVALVGTRVPATRFAGRLHLAIITLMVSLAVCVGLAALTKKYRDCGRTVQAHVGKADPVTDSIFGAIFFRGRRNARSTKRTRFLTCSYNADNRGYACRCEELVGCGIGCAVSGQTFASPGWIVPRGEVGIIVASLGRGTGYLATPYLSLLSPCPF